MGLAAFAMMGCEVMGVVVMAKFAEHSKRKWLKGFLVVLMTDWAGMLRWAIVCKHVHV